MVLGWFLLEYFYLSLVEILDTRFPILPDCSGQKFLQRDAHQLCNGNAIATLTFQGREEEVPLLLKAVLCLPPNGQGSPAVLHCFPNYVLKQ